MMNAEFALDENQIPLKSGLLFAGHYNGQISLVSSKGDVGLGHCTPVITPFKNNGIKFRRHTIRTIHNLSFSLQGSKQINNQIKNNNRLL